MADLLILMSVQEWNPREELLVDLVVMRQDAEKGAIMSKSFTRSNRYSEESAKIFEFRRATATSLRRNRPMG